MQLNQNLTGRELSRHMRPIFQKYGVLPPCGADMAEARNLAAELIGGELVATETLQRVQAYTDCAVAVAHEEGQVTGVLAWVHLNAAGVDAVMSGAFDVFNPAEAHMAAPDEIVCGTYGWGIAASTKPTAKRLGAVSEEGAPLYEHVARFARIATEAGRRFMCDRLGYRELPGSDLVWLPATAPIRTAEAA
ncbi:hypothetical protein [Phenylobacterium sp.]|uniref:hypothetical protein n=1 Tax=Phenylobacterium sp. TaxID=1871053 RepID=UPI00261334CB|nr:hypothetical protein [Phenylobacterium sp.]